MPTDALTPSREPLGGGRFYYGWVIVGVGALVAFSSGPGQSFVFSVFIDSMIDDTGFSRSTISALYTVSTGVSALMVAVISRMADRWGARSNLILVGVAFGAACFGMAFSAGLAAFYVSFAGLRALGQGSLTINATLMVNQWFVTKRGRAIAVMGLGFPLSNAVLPPLARFLIDTIGWREAYGVLGIIVMLLVIPPAIFLVRNRPEDMGLHPDGADEAPLTERAVGYDPAVAARRRVLTSLGFWMLAIPLATPGLVVTALVFHQTSIFEENGLSATTAAAVFVVFAIASASTSMAAGFLVDRIGPARLFMVAMVGLMTVCLLALVLNSIWMALVYVVGMGMTGGTQRIVQGVIWAHYYGRVGLGRVQGSATMVGITGAAIGPLPLALMHRLTGSYDFGVIVMATLPVLSILAVTLGHPERRIAAGIAAESASP
ncbi:MAG: MFS transporter [Chloroflexi bacterium]|nr:MFS transporter [Chloroflexota bacterium]MDA1145672.1 MFS transporter [Chloroflexota bacterium]